MDAGTHEARYAYGYERSRDQDSAMPAHHRVIVVGAGPVGLATAIDLAQRGVRVVLLDDNDCIGAGSRAICFSKRALEVCDRLGVGDRMVDKGVTWQVGRVFLGDGEVYRFDLAPEPGYKRPAFINLQQYYVEAYLVDRAAALDRLEIRWRNRVGAVEAMDDHVALTVDTPDGPYRLTADWLVACDGARSPVRDMLGLAFEGRTFHDRFLIVDVRMRAGFPSERWFWFDPPFHQGQSTLLHKQPDDIWRIDFQLGPDADPTAETAHERVVPRLKAMLGDVDFEIEWVSVYTFQCRRLERFVHGRVLFAGDAAHQVSPFGARGANSGFEDAHNLAWKLASVIHGEASATLLESYDHERRLAADDNIGHSTRSTDFISPKSPAARLFRTAALDLARTAAFARAMVNSGRLSRPTAYAGTPLSTPDEAPFAGMATPGAPAPDAPMRDRDGNPLWLIDALEDGFTALVVGNGARPNGPPGIAIRMVGEDLIDAEGLFAARYDARPGSVYLVRPDQYLCARFRAFDAGALAAARRRALGAT